MGQSVATIDLGKVFQGTAAGSGGTFTADYAIPVDTGVILTAYCIAGHATAPHLDGAAGLHATYFVQSKNAVVSAPTALSGSTNPSNSNTTTFVAARAQAADAGIWAGGSPTLTWSISGANARCTFTNTGATATVNVTIVIQAIIVGST